MQFNKSISYFENAEGGGIACTSAANILIDIQNPYSNSYYHQDYESIAFALALNNGVTAG